MPVSCQNPKQTTWGSDKVLRTFDETLIILTDMNGRIKTLYTEKSTVPTVKHGRGSVLPCIKRFSSKVCKNQSNQSKEAQIVKKTMIQSKKTSQLRNSSQRIRRRLYHDLSIIYDCGAALETIIYVCNCFVQTSDQHL